MHLKAQKRSSMAVYHSEMPSALQPVPSLTNINLLYVPGKMNFMIWL